MTTMTQSKVPTIPSASSPRAGFPTIPTRIRDTRDAQVPPLVVEPVSEQNKAAMRQSLGELGSKLAEIHRTAAEAWLSQSCYTEALPHLEAAATFSAGDADYQQQLGYVRYLVGDDVGAINAFNNVLASDSKNSEAWFNLGMVLFGQEQFTEAEDCFRHTCELQPDDSQTWNNRGVCLWKMNRANDARACFQRALQIDPSDADAQHNMSSLRN